MKDAARLNERKITVSKSAGGFLLSQDNKGGKIWAFGD